MKKNLWIIFLALVSASLLAQQPTNAPGAAPAAKSQKKKAAKKKSTTAVTPPDLKTVPLVAGPAVVVASNVNVRGQAKLNSEVITRLTKGDAVTVIEEVTLKKSGPDEPSAWAKIALPSKAHAWVNSSFIEPTNKTVIPKKLKLRGGPGENYSVLGILKRGDAVKEVSAKDDWTEIEAPAEAYAFMAAQYLTQEAAPVLAATPPAPAEPPPAAAPVTEEPALAAAASAPPVTPPAVEPTPAPAEPAVAAVAPEPAPPPADEPPPKRIVQREGYVRGTISIQAPTQFELVSPDTRKTINYLYTTSPQLDLRRYKGLHIIVTGEEGLDERWRNTPVITIQKIQVLD